MKTKNILSAIIKKTSFMIIGLLIIHNLQAQLSQLQTSWKLDSIQIEENNTIKSTILTGEQTRFEDVKLLEFTLHTNNTASYTNEKESVANIPYSIQTDGDGYKLAIYCEPDTKNYRITTPLEGQLVLTYTFNGGFIQSPIAVSWKFYYSRID